MKKCPLFGPKKMVFITPLWRLLTVHLTVFCLLFLPLHSSIAAFEDDNDWVGAMSSALIQGAGIYQQYQRSNTMQNYMMYGIQSYTPRPVPAKFFPGCMIGPAISAFPENIKNTCDMNQIASPMELQQIMMIQEAARINSNFYEALITPAQNSRTPTGMTCLNDGRKQVRASINDRMNGLQAIADQVKKQTQLFRDANQKIINDLKDLNTELYGSNKRKRAKGKNTNFNSYFSPSCRSVIKSSNLSQATRKGGLIGLRDNTLTDINQEASEMKDNKTTYERELHNQITRMQRDIQTKGFEDWQQDIATDFVQGGETEFGGVLKVMGREINYYNRAYSRVKKNLKKEIGEYYKLPDRDTNFSVDVDNFKAGAKHYMQKRFIDDCMNMKGSNAKGLVLTPAQILKGLRQESTGNFGTTIITYTAALEAILNTDAFIADKMQQIKALDNEYGNQITIHFRNQEGKSERLNPYQLFQREMDICRTKFAQDDTFGAEGTISYQTRIERAQKYLNEISHLHKTFPATLANAISNQVLNCNGRALKSGQCKVGNQKNSIMNPTNKNFCISQASECASKVHGCFAEVETVVQGRITLMKTAAAVYNKNIEELVARQETFLKQVQAQVTVDAQYLQNFYPGATFKYPKDLFVAMPKMEDAQFGIDLRGDGKLDFLKNLPKKIETLKKNLLGQAKRVDDQIKEYNKTQKTAMEKNKKKWDGLRRSCIQAEAAYRTQYGKQMTAAMKKKADSEKWCRRFGMLQRSPAAGCDDDSSYSAAELYRDVMGITEEVAVSRQNISTEAIEAVGDFANYCAQVQAEKNDEEDGGDNTAEVVAALCESNDEDQVLSKLANMIEEKLPKGFGSSKKREVRSLIKGDHQDDIDGEIEDIDDDILDDDLGLVLKNINKLKKKSDPEIDGNIKTSLKEEINKRINKLCFTKEVPATPDECMRERKKEDRDITTDQEIRYSKFFKRYINLRSAIEKQDFTEDENDFCKRFKRKAFNTAANTVMDNIDEAKSFGDEFETLVENGPDKLKKVGNYMAGLHKFEVGGDSGAVSGEIVEGIECSKSNGYTRNYLDDYDREVLGAGGLSELVDSYTN